ncbi:Trimethylguanosine synthase [Ceratocystis lukuohia]|uniref:Trimethylguanosine synthase n=1 Tax=Ceratocystis lukuohia TaxID=2019550 RepID=A0ABR4MEK9_9PEZI
MVKLLTEDLPLTPQCVHFEKKEDVPHNIAKYWAQRYSIFSLYDEGILFTDDAWFGVTPEPIANQIAYDMSPIHTSKTVIIDCFGGIGGNSIAFALSGRWEHVVCVERDASTLACAQRNAKLYDVPPGIISFVHGDSFMLLELASKRPKKLPKKLRLSPDNTVIFASPPWGGPGYVSDSVFDLSGMQPYSLADLHGAYKCFDHALFLPRTSDLRQIADLVPDGNDKIEVVQYCMNGASKALVAYILGQAGEEVDVETGTEVRPV